VLAAIAGAGCEGWRPAPSSNPADPVTLTIYCGTGLRAMADPLVDEFQRHHPGVNFQIEVGGSEHMVAKIKQNPTGDLFLPGDRHYVDLLAETDLILLRRTVCTVAPVILVPRDNPKKIKKLTDLLRPDVKLGLGDEDACAVGRTSRELFEKNHLDWEDARSHAQFHSPSINALAEQITLGKLDAVLVWDAVAAAVGDHGQIVPIPADQNVIATIEIAVLGTSVHPELAGQFMEFLNSEVARGIIRQQGYRVEAVASR
jgi:molybdate transport system substrate-binding protein